MQIYGEPKAYLHPDAKALINLYSQLGERAENFLPKYIIDNLTHFVQLCYEEPDDPQKQQVEINKYILELKEAIPGYTTVSLMLYPTETSKAFQYAAQKLVFKKKLRYLIDTEGISDETKKLATNILNSYDYSVGTPPITQDDIDFLSLILLGDRVEDLRKYREVIGIKGDKEEAHWTFFMDVLDQMVNQFSHYTTQAEKEDFLRRTESSVNFKGLNGFIRTVVGGSADTAVDLIKGDVFHKDSVAVINDLDSPVLYQKMLDKPTSIFVVKAKHVRKNIFANEKWFPLLTRLIIVDDSPEAQSSNTSLVFCFHNGIINTLNNIHTKKIGALANSQLNLRLILDKVNRNYLHLFRTCIEKKIQDYEQELDEIKREQLGTTDNPDKDMVLYRFDEFTKQILRDKFAMQKLRDFVVFIENTRDPQNRKAQNTDLVNELEERMLHYFYGKNDKALVSTVLEGGGRNQIRTYGRYLLQRRLNKLLPEIKTNAQTIIDIIPNNFKRTLHNHFHKNFGLNLFLERYREFIMKVENEASNKGRFQNILIDLGIADDYKTLEELDKQEEDKTTEEGKKKIKRTDIIKRFISDLANLDKTSISDDVQMIIRDLLKDEKPRPYILFNPNVTWEYKDLLPEDRFDINPFDLEIENTPDGHINYENLLIRLKRIKATMQLFDATGSLWDRFCENLTILINDPSNPTGYTDFNQEALNNFIKFISTSKITIFIDEAYNDAIKIEDPDEPKWRTISRYILNNVNVYSKISIVSSLSTTKNLQATGARLGCLIASQARRDVIEFAKKLNNPVRGNNVSLFILNNSLETAQLAKKIKDRIETNLPKDASRQKVKKWIERFVTDESKSREERNSNYEKLEIKAQFEGSPLHVFLLDELIGLDKLEVLGLPDDFKYKGNPFFKYYINYLARALNKFRVNRKFRREANNRLKMAKQAASDFIKKQAIENVTIVDADGSYLFNIHLHKFFSYQDLEKFTKKLAAARGIAVLPYKTGMVRFSLGGYIQGTHESYQFFKQDFTNALEVFFKYWNIFAQQMQNVKPNEETRSDDILESMFKASSDKQFINHLLDDFHVIKNLNRPKYNTLLISDITTLYHATPQVSGISINTISKSKNSVIEFGENIGMCNDVIEFVQSVAFTKIYENLLPQIYEKIPQLKGLSFNYVNAKYGKSAILKYIKNKRSYQPNNHVLDDVDEKNIMCEILIELEQILFSDAKTKILALKASQDNAVDKARLEGINQIMRKYIKELLLYFNLPFEKEAVEPSIEQLTKSTIRRFEEVIGKSVEELNLDNYVDEFIYQLRTKKQFAQAGISQRTIGFIIDAISKNILHATIDTVTKLLYLYLLRKDSCFYSLVISKIKKLDAKISEISDTEIRLIRENFVFEIAPGEFTDIMEFIFSKKDIKIKNGQLEEATRDLVKFMVYILNKTKEIDYYERYTHTIMRMVVTEFKQQNSFVNEMIQHGITVHQNFEPQDRTLLNYQNGALKWINEVMSKCGVIASEQPVQMHTRIATDAKKRESPFHKIDRYKEQEENTQDEAGNDSANNYIKKLAVRPSSEFFARRLAKFVENIDTDDYRCKIIQVGVVKELVVFHKSYMKYLTDNYRLNFYHNIKLEEAQGFIPQVIEFLGAPEKVISYPEIGYFDLEGPEGSIKTLVTPLKQKIDYFGNIKKPHLTMLNEKVKDMGGIPIHGSLFAVEEEDGALFVVAISGDSGAGKSEMIAALILKWLKKILPGIRSIKLVAGDMFHEFMDTEGNLYAIGTEVGDFSRVTDFDPEFINYYKILFESSADSNVEDLNSRSTISGLCEISMPYKIDILLTASNYAKEEAGITRYDNPENFVLYRDSHAERKEKATSQDAPNFQRTLRRKTYDNNIMQIMSKHGNYLDTVLNWEKDTKTGMQYLASSFKMMDKIDIEQLVEQIFVNKTLRRHDSDYKIHAVSFDIIRNRFNAVCKPLQPEDAGSIPSEIEVVIDRALFSQLFDSIASTPAGQPFVAEVGQVEASENLIKILKGGTDGKGKGKQIQLGVLSTDLGKKGKEITGPQKAAQDMLKMIQEVRIERPEIQETKNKVREIILQKYPHIFEDKKLFSPEIWRYNFFLYQLDQMRKAEFVRVDRPNEKVDLTGVQGFKPRDKNEEFSPLLVTPNINLELDSFCETYEQLMYLPNNESFADDFEADVKNVYIAEGYTNETKVNNMIVQLLLMNGFINIDDICRSRITEKANRETLAAAKFAVMKKLKKTENKPKETGTKKTTTTTPKTRTKNTGKVDHTKNASPKNDKDVNDKKSKGDENK